MSQYNWYSLERKLYEAFNAGRTKSYHSSDIRVYFRDFLNHFKKHPEDFTSDMVLDMNLAIVAKINGILTKNLPDNEPLKKEKFEELFKIAQEASVASNMSSSRQSKGHLFGTNFESDMNLYSAKGKKNYVTEVKMLQEDLTLFKNTNWYNGLKFEHLFANVEPSKVQKTIAFKNFILSLDKYFPFLKTDENYKIFKDEFFQSYYQKIKKETNVFYNYPFTEIISFLKDSYSEEVLKIVLNLSKDVPAYSYLKNKASIDKIMSIYPESKDVLTDYLNEIGEVYIDDIFKSDEYTIIPITIDFVAVEKTLLLDRIKSTAHEVFESFKSIVTRNKNENSPFSWYFMSDNVNVTSKEYISSFLFKVPKSASQSIGDEVIKNFIQKQFLDFVNEYPKNDKSKKYSILWQEVLMKKELEEVPIHNNTVSSVKKY